MSKKTAGSNGGETPANAAATPQPAETEQTKEINIKANTPENEPAKAESTPDQTAEAEKTEGEAKAEPEANAEEAADKTVQPAEAGEYSAAEGTDASLLSEFAPKPMNIPNVNLEKEKKKQEKRKQNHSKEIKKVESRKNRGKKKMSAGRRFAAAFASFLLFIVLTGFMTGFIGVFSTQIATSDYAFRLSVKNMDIAEITIGSIDDYERLGMRECSKKAALVDIFRDNSDVVVTYKEIISSIKSSSVENFIAGEMKEASDHLLLGREYTPVTGNDISMVIKENATLVRNLTGRVLTDEDYANIASYFEEYGHLEDVSLEAVDSTALSKYTQYTRRLMSVKILAALLLMCIFLIVLICVVGRGYAHIPLGWSFILSGVFVVVAGILFRPSFAVNTAFLSTVLKTYFNFFSTTVIVIASIFTVIGAFIFLVGNASAEHDD